jgi:hypothetical protein
MAQLQTARSFVSAPDARAIVEAAHGRGAVAVDRAMIDLPAVARAVGLLSDEKRSMLHAE